MPKDRQLLTPHQRQEVRQRREAGETLVSIARSYSVHHATIGRLCAGPEHTDSTK